MNKLYIIGIGFRPFDKRASEIIYNSNLILTTSNRLYELFKEHEEFKEVKDRIKVITNVDETIEFIKSEIRNLKPEIQTVALIASGDPMFHGIGRRAVKEFGKDMVEILPDLSCVQIAFSRIKEPWDDAFLISFHRSGILEKNKYEIDDIPLLLTRHNKIAILTNERNNPTEIAKTLLKSQIPNPKSQIIIYVCERLGYDDEKIIEGAPDVILKMEFLSPNVVILQNRAGEPPPHPPLEKGGRGDFQVKPTRAFGSQKRMKTPHPSPLPSGERDGVRGDFRSKK